MNQFIFIDGQVLQPNGQIQQLNLLFKSGLLVGKGYLPDEDESSLKTYPISGQLVLPKLLALSDLGLISLDCLLDPQLNHLKQQVAKPIYGIVIDLLTHTPDDIKACVSRLTYLNLPIVLSCFDRLYDRLFIQSMLDCLKQANQYVCMYVSDLDLQYSVISDLKRMYPGLQCAIDSTQFPMISSSVLPVAFDCVDMVFSSDDLSQSLQQMVVRCDTVSVNFDQLCLKLSWNGLRFFKYKPFGFTLGEPISMVVLSSDRSKIDYQVEQGCLIRSV